MSQTIVNTINAIEVSPELVSGADPDVEFRRRLRASQRQIARAACSSTWREDCLYRGAEYEPDFHCQCGQCAEKFPHRLHPRDYRESDYSSDCQVEQSEVDDELAEDLTRLRNERQRIGSVFLRVPRQEIETRR
jgi:hypothetical protein